MVLKLCEGLETPTEWKYAIVTNQQTHSPEKLFSFGSEVGECLFLALRR